MCDEDCVPRVLHVPAMRAPRKIAVTARPTSPTHRVVNCFVSAASDADLRGISIYVHTFDFVFEKGCSYAISFDSQFLPRTLVLKDLEATGNGAKTNIVYPVRHPFAETMDRCFIERCS